jgi:hypothetical protein
MSKTYIRDKSEIMSSDKSDIICKEEIKKL